MRFVYATDLHGNRDAIEQAFKLAHDERVDAIVFGGDLTPKSVAIKLARHPDSFREEDECGEIPLLGDEVLPTSMLIEGAALCPTFTQSLRGIKRLNERVGADALARHFERTGALIIEQPNQYYDLGSMLAEQILLDKLSRFFYDASAQGRNLLQISEEEMYTVRDCVAEWFKEFEASWSVQERAEFSLKCACLLGLQQCDFEQFAPSKYIERCVLRAISNDVSMGEVTRTVEGLLKEVSEPLAEHLLETLRAECKRLFQADAYRTLIVREHINTLVRYSTIARLKLEMENPVRVAHGQAKFLQDYFLPLVREWRKSRGDRPVYAMLGNDDIQGNILLLEEAEERGELRHLHGKIHEFGNGFVIIGYSFVESLLPGVEYREWVKKGPEILADLQSLQPLVGQKRSIWVIHQPPFGCLDQVEDKHIGSQSVLQFLADFQPPLALLGHIHEAPRLTGACAVQLGKTLCVNSGGEHGKGLQAVVINTETLEIERRQVP